MVLKPNALNAQNLKHYRIIVQQTSLKIDTLPIVEGSIILRKNNIKITEGFSYSDSTQTIVFDSSFFNQEIEIIYRTFNLNFNTKYAHKSPLMIEPTYAEKPRYFYNNEKVKNGNPLLNSNGLDINGNIARGLGFGNNQDVVLNSNLNLQIGGNLGKGISILAAISDENNPIQPEGNTQQIQDFDKVFITFKKDSSTLTVGDVLMANNRENYFMKYYKKSRGAQFDINTGKNLKHNIHLDAAISRGRFARNQIQGTEGNQGPYRLQGNNGELNIIVISGTEVVYIDGEKLNRGQQNDYVIDYNMGEVIFMPKKLITQYSRIVIEFQYSDRNYNRSVFTVGNTFETKKWTTSINYFTEQDNKLQPTDTSNSNTINQILEQAGDNPTLFQNIKTYKEFPTDRIVYIKKDSIVNFTNYTYFKQVSSKGNDTVFYTLSFSFAGQGKGNYMPIASAANGRVYGWVAPVGGQLQGSYEPYIQLVAPNRMQMLSISTRFKINSNSNLKIESAYTNYNQNTYSVLDKKNDDGIGLFLDFNQKNIAWKKLKLTNQAKVEYVSSNFKAVERYRSVEFDRNWNKQLSNISSLRPALYELISTANSNIAIQKSSAINIELGNYLRGNQFKGYRTALGYMYTNKKLNITSATERLNTQNKPDSITTKNVFLRYNAGINYKFKNLQIGTEAIAENSQFNTDTSSKLGTASYSFTQYSATIQSLNLTKWNYRLESSVRQDKLPANNTLQNSTLATNIKGNIEHLSKKNNRLAFTTNYRELISKNAATEQIILSRMEYNAAFFKKVMNFTTYYQISTGREQRKQFSYTQVLPGNGTHDWIDYNSNGIQEINEFELAAFTDKAQYVKIYLPTNEFIKSNTNEYNQTIRLQTPQTWQNGNKLKRSISRFNTITSYKADRRITDNSFATIVNPFKLNVADSALITINSLIKQTTFYNRNSPKFGLEHSIQTTRGKQFLNSGFETKKIYRQNITSRYAFTKQTNIVVIAEQQNKENANQFFENRTYKYNVQSIFPELFYQNIKGIRLGIFYKYTEAKNADNSINNAYIKEIGAEARYFVINKGNIDAKITNHIINYKGNNNSPLAYDLLNGLSNGRNLTWNITFGGKAAGNIQLNISYEGRKTPVFKTIHIGRAEARYIF